MKKPTTHTLRDALLGSALSLSVSTSPAFSAGADEFDNTLSVITSYYAEAPVSGEDRPQISSLSLNSEVFLDLSNQLQLTISPYLQYEHLSEDNTHLDLRKFLFLLTGERWEIEAGIGQEYWGVAESRQVVDTINQRDFAADFRGDQKLGQPLLKISAFTDYGDFSGYLLPWFREPEYASPDSRPRLPLAVNESLSTYQSTDTDRHLDYALRWTGTAGVWDVGLHYFNGTRRQPLLRPTDQGLASRFILMNQLGVDAQATLGALLAKIELIQQSSDEIESHTESVAGIEYTLSQVLSSQADIGLLAEFLYDSRQDQADHLFQRDVMLGIRWSLNDPSSTELLITQTTDLDNSSKSIQLEFGRRIGPNFTVGLEGTWWRDTEEDQTLSTLSTEDSVQLRLNWFF